MPVRAMYSVKSSAKVGKRYTLESCFKANVTHLSSEVYTMHCKTEGGPNDIMNRRNDMDRILKSLGAIAAVVAVLMVLAACGGAEYEPTREGQPAPTRVSPVRTTAPHSQPQATRAPTQRPCSSRSARRNRGRARTTKLQHHRRLRHGQQRRLRSDFLPAPRRHPFIDTEDDNLSTFAIDVDTASYTVARRFIHDGNLPDPDSVRVEEFVNFFDHGYERPTRDAFAIHVDGSPSPFGGANHWLMRVGLQGRDIGAHQRKDATLIFTIDVSGSMAREDRLELVKKSLRLLVDELRPSDEVGIVIYGTNGQVLAGADQRPQQADNHGGHRPAGTRRFYLRRRRPPAGLRHGYRLHAPRPDHPGAGALRRRGQCREHRSGSYIAPSARHVDRGITLTTVGVGMGNYNDVLMEQLADEGNGSYHYVDELSEAHRIFVENLSGTLQVIAKDAKVQVDFNPDVVRSYRLLGYENRDIADEEFRDDDVDAGEIGAGHSVTALYELKLHGATGALGTVFVRYEDPESGGILEVSRTFEDRELHSYFEDALPRFQLAAVVAEYAEILRESYWARDGSLDLVVAEARRVQGCCPANRTWPTSPT